MQLLFLLLLLVVPFLVLTLVNRSTRFRISSSTRARVGLSLFFLFTSVGHFIRTEDMAAMLPPAIPSRVELIYLTGALELLGALGVWIPGLMRLTGVCLILMLVGILPANIFSAINHVEFGGHAAGPVYLLIRVPFQLFLICWTYFATEQHWF
ncbi:MAG: DoxX family protein [Acidobacteriota bacterium]|nr:DoxX family protein [Acidobacteriota bacterium]